MQIAKLRMRDDTGLVPAGRYFQRLARQLESSDRRETPQRQRIDRHERTARDLQAPL